MRLFYLLVVCVSLCLACGRKSQIELDTDPKNQLVKLDFSYDHYAMLVADLELEVDWLQRVFGVEEIYDGTEQPHIRWFTLGNGQTLHVIAGSYDQLLVPKPVHLALRTPDLDAFITHLTRIGIPYEDWPGAASQVSVRPDRFRQVYVRSPAGYYIEVNDADGIDRRL